MQVVAVGRDEVRHACQVAAVLQHLGEVGHDVHGELGQAVHAEPGNLVGHGLVGEALHEGLLVQLEVHLAGRGHVLGDVLVHEVLNEFDDGGVVHGGVHLAVSVQEGRVRQQGVRRVQQAQLHVLVACDVLAELDVLELVPVGPARDEVVLDDPLDVVLGEDGHEVVGAVLLVQAFCVSLAGGGRDPVDHGVGERAVLFDPCGELGVLCLEEGGEGLLAGVAVVLQVVAGQDGHGAAAGLHARPQAFSNVTEWCLGSGGVLQVVSHVGLGQHELASGVVEVVAALGDGHGDDLDVLVGHLVDQALGVLDCPDQVNARADLVCLVHAVTAAHRQAVEAVLLLHATVAGLVEREQQGAADAPVLVARLLQELVRVEAHVGTVEVALADMKDASLNLAAVILEANQIALLHAGVGFREILR